MELHPIAVMLIGVEVDCSMFIVRLPPESIWVLRQLKSAGNTHNVCTNALGLKTPNA
jgi:hypothetical protein